MAETVTFWWRGPTEEEIAEGIRRSIEGPEVVVYISEYPPLPGERSKAYQARVLPLLLARKPPSLWGRVKAFFRS